MYQDMRKNNKGASLEFLTTKRPPAIGTKGAVASPHYLATQVGQEVLKKGGHAVDAAIAMNTVISVVYPHMGGLGGDLIALIWDRDTNEVEELNGSGKSGKDVDDKLYGEEEAIPERGPLSANTIPGTVDGWWEMHQKYGKMEWQSLFTAAIDYAENGFPISDKLSNMIKEKKEIISAYEETKNHFIRNGHIPLEGEIFKQPDLAHSLKLIAEKGPDVFYNGEIAEKIVNSLEKHGGKLTKEDFDVHQAEWSTPMSTSYRGHDIFEVRPNTQGIAALIIFNILEEIDIQEIGDNTPDYYHLMTEATKLAFLYRDTWVTDERDMDIDPEIFSTNKLGKVLNSRIHKDYVTSEIERQENLPIFKTNEDTTYMCAVDQEGNAVSLIQSIYHEFGSAFMPEETGFVLHNRGSSFSLDSDHPNYIKPGKHPFHTIIPAMVMKNGKPVMLMGSMGGEGQPQTQAAILTRVIDFGYNIQQAIEAPRWLHGRTWGDDSDTLKLEGRISDGIVEALSRRGQHVERLANWTDTMGHAQGITIDQNTGVLSAGADPRGDGLGLSW